jgi:hypothetical protein
MRVRLRGGILNCSVRLWVPVQQRAVIDESARTIRRDWSRIPVANTSPLLSAVAVTRTFASMYCTAGQTDGDTSMEGRRR